MPNAPQIAWGFDGSVISAIPLPAPSQDVLPGIPWGRADELFTPAFWKYQSRLQRTRGRYRDHQIGQTLLEEVAACLLGGFGLPAELGLAAFRRLRDEGLLDGQASASEIEASLSKTFAFEGRARRYRFPRLKARYLAPALAAIRDLEPPACARSLRTFLMELDGVGPKTSSWVVRNYLASDEVAILDVHVVRAGIAIGLFESCADPARNYFGLEHRFLEFCVALDEPASTIDAIMWDYMRRIGTLARRQDATKLGREAN